MKALDVPPLALAAGAVGLGVIVYAMATKKPGQSLAGSIASGAVGATADAAAGAVVGLGEVVGIPATSADQCSIDLANGDYWAASFSCPAKRFLAATSDAIFGGTPPAQDTPFVPGIKDTNSGW